MLIAMKRFLGRNPLILVEEALRDQAGIRGARVII
jgi:hypothetical protein